jgi:cyclic beta-1,2-glucan synthetase
VEPYAICADIYSVEPYLRRGGWTWYTGSASWVYRLGLEGILGFEKIGNTLSINPTIPPDWDGFEIQYQYRNAKYIIQVKNPQQISHGVKQVTLDGVGLDHNTPIPLQDDGQEHVIEVTLGA